MLDEFPAPELLFGIAQHVRHDTRIRLQRPLSAHGREGKITLRSHEVHVSRAVLARAYVSPRVPC
jgi:hypothetical protein